MENAGTNLRSCTEIYYTVTDFCLGHYAICVSNYLPLNYQKKRGLSAYITENLNWLDSNADSSNFSKLILLVLVVQASALGGDRIPVLFHSDVTRC